MKTLLAPDALGKIRQRIAGELEKRRRERLNERIIRAYSIDSENPDPLDLCKARYHAAIALAGNPPEQIQNFERAGVILQPKQLEFAASARLADNPDFADEIGFGGARGPGKSFALFAQAALDDCQRIAGLKVLYLRKTSKTAEEQIRDLISSVLAYTPHEYVKGEVRFPNGSKIIIGHFRTEKQALEYQGLEYDLIIIEETTQLSKQAYTALQGSARTSKAWRPRTYASTNPLGPGHTWFKKKFVTPEREVAGKPRPPKMPTRFIFATLSDNHFIDPFYKDRLLRNYTGILAKAFIEGNWDVSSGAYFTNWNFDIHVIPPFMQNEAEQNARTIPPDWVVWASMDYGFQHYNMTYFHCISGDGLTYTFHELAHRKLYPEQIAPLIHNALALYGLTVHELAGFFAGSDVFSQTGHSKETVAQKYQAFDIMLSSAITGPGSRVQRAHHIAQLLGDTEAGIPPKWFITANCTQLIECLPILEIDPNNPEDVLKINATETEIGDDPYDGCSYGLYRQVGTMA